LEKPSPFELYPRNPRNPFESAQSRFWVPYFAQQQLHPSTQGVLGEHLSPHLQSQYAPVFALVGAGVAGVLPAKLVAVSVNRIPEMRTKSFFMFVFEKLINENIVVKRWEVYLPIH
jgi:hypothetical protein